MKAAEGTGGKNDAMLRQSVRDRRNIVRMERRGQGSTHFVCGFAALFGEYTLLGPFCFVVRSSQFSPSRRKLTCFTGAVLNLVARI